LIHSDKDQRLTTFKQALTAATRGIAARPVNVHFGSSNTADINLPGVIEMPSAGAVTMACSGPSIPPSSR
jgi:hypothetical protein